MLWKILLFPFQFLGSGLISIYKMTLLGFEAWLKIFQPPFDYREFSTQLIKIGFNSIPVVIVTAFFTGAVLSLMIAGPVSEKVDRVTVLNGTVIGFGMLTAIGPVLTALITTGKSGSGIAAEIGTMKVTEQIDALKTLATDPVKYLVVPRLLAAMLSLPILTIIADLAGIVGGYFVSIVQLHLTAENFFERLAADTRIEQFYIGLIKATAFGAIIAVVSCAKGFETSGGAEGVGKSTTKAVVLSSMGILISNYLLTVLLET